MSVLSTLRNIIPERSPIRLTYHKFSAMLAAVWYRFPSHRLHVIAVTGTSGKSSTVEMIQSLLQACGRDAGSLSTIQFHIKDQIFHNESLRTSLRPNETHKMLKKMRSAGCKYAVVEISSHALDQNRMWGVAVDTAILTNISNNEHLDYHKTFDDYIRTKKKLFQNLNSQYRKPGIDKTIILNADDENLEYFQESSADKKWTYARRKNGNVKASNIEINLEVKAKENGSIGDTIRVENPITKKRTIVMSAKTNRT